MQCMVWDIFEVLESKSFSFSPFKKMKPRPCRNLLFSLCMKTLNHYSFVNTNPHPQRGEAEYTIQRRCYLEKPFFTLYGNAWIASWKPYGRIGNAYSASHISWICTVLPERIPLPSRDFFSVLPTLYLRSGGVRLIFFF